MPATLNAIRRTARRMYARPRTSRGALSVDQHRREAGNRARHRKHRHSRKRLGAGQSLWKRHRFGMLAIWQRMPEIKQQ